MVTIQDVARAAGVSAMTVSNVINSHPHVREETKGKVLQAMSDLDYRINVAARNLRVGRTDVIGLAVTEIDMPYWGQLAALIIIEAERRGLKVAIEQTGASPQSELDALAMSRNRMYDGLILSTVGVGIDDVEKLRIDYPVVILGERIFQGPVDHVGMSNIEGSEAAVRHLIDQGRRRIAMVDGPKSSQTDMSGLRFEGYRSALEGAGLTLDLELVLTLPSSEGFTMNDGRTVAREMVDSGISFDAVFCVTDTVALGVMRGLADRGVRVPDDVMLIGFDNIREGEFSVPSLSTVDPDHATMARRAVELLVERIDHKGSDPKPATEFISTYTVIPRESTGFVPRSM